MTVRDFYKICEENNLLDYTIVTPDLEEWTGVDLEFGSNIVTFKKDKVLSISEFWDV